MHLLDAHQIAVVVVAHLADRHIEVDLVVHQVGLVLAQVERNARGAQQRPGDRVADAVLLRQDAGVAQPVDEDPVAGDDLVEIRQQAPHLRDVVARQRGKGTRHAVLHAADADVVRGNARAA